jgi:hypothetical protein
MELTKLPMFGLSLDVVAFRGTASHEESREPAATSLALRLTCLTETESVSRGLESRRIDAGELA